MKAEEFLTEKKVTSTWISELIYNRPNKKLTMRLSNGKAYSVLGISRAVFDQWNKTPSKGKYFHDRIKANHQITPVR